jgi:hypothetical protein
MLMQRTVPGGNHCLIQTLGMNIRDIIMNIANLEMNIVQLHMQVKYKNCQLLPKS